MTMLRIGPDVLGHPAVDQDQAPGECLGERIGDRAASSSAARRRGRAVQEAMGRQQAAPADAPLGVALGGGDALDQLDAGKDPPESCQPPPEPPSHSPRIARATTTLASSGSSGPVRLRAWPVARIKSAISEASRLVETASRDPLGMSLTLLTISSPWPGRTIRASRSASRVLRSLEGRGDQPRGDHRRLDQAQVVVAEVEQLLQAVDVLAGVQVDARQAEDRLGDDPQPATRSAGRGVDRGRGRPGRPRYSAPARLRENPCPGRRCRTSRCARGPAAPASARPGSGRAPSSDSRSRSRGMDPQRVLVGAADPEHPAVALAAPDRAPHLVGQGLKGDLFVGLRQRAGRSRRWARRAASSRGTWRSPARTAAPSGP